MKTSRISAGGSIRLTAHIHSRLSSRSSRAAVQLIFGVFALTVVAFSPLAVAAQTTTAPIVVRSSSAPVKASWMKVEVIRADSNSMVVREQANQRMIHTFTYTPALQAQMQKIVDAGGAYQYGDKIKILCQQGQTVALRIAGTPSKPR